MRIAVLVDPLWSLPARAAAYPPKIAEKYPDAIVISTGIGGSVYAVERAALKAGLRVAAIRVEPHGPIGVRTTVWRDPDDESPPDPPPTPSADLKLYELRPGDQQHYDSLSHYDAKTVETVKGIVEAEDRALEWAIKSADNVVAFTERPDWPQTEAEVHRLGVS